MQGGEHPEGVLSQQHNQTIMITGGQAQQQQPLQTPPIQQVRKKLFFVFEIIKLIKIVFEIKGQGMMQGQMQKLHVQNQQIVLTPSQSPQHNSMQMQTLSPQQQKPQQQSPQVNAVPGQPQYIRAARYVLEFLKYKGKCLI